MVSVELTEQVYAWINVVFVADLFSAEITWNGSAWNSMIAALGLNATMLENPAPWGPITRDAVFQIDEFGRW